MKVATRIDSKRLLGICIPTYNRPESLGLYLRVLIPQVKRYGYPVYISDNSTDTRTEALVRRLSKSYRNLRYHKNKKNVGMGRNMKLVLEMADTVYVWMTSDDDMLAGDAVDAVRNELLKGYDFVQVNAEVYDSALRKRMTLPVVKDKEDRDFKPGEQNQFLLHCKNYETYMGGMVIRRSLIMNRLKKANMADRVNQFYVHAYVYLRGIVNAKGRYLARPLIKIRGNAPTYSDSMMDIEYVYYPRLISGLPRAYSRETVEAVLRRPITGMLLSVMYTRKLGRHGFGYYYSRIKNSPGVSSIRKALILALVILPPQVLEACAALYSRLTKLIASA